MHCKKIKVVCVVYYPGPVNMVLPVLKKITNNTTIEIVIVTTEQWKASFIFNKELIVIKNKFTMETAKKFIEKLAPDLLLISPTEHCDDITGKCEILFANIAECKGIPVIALIDHWTCYEKRFFCKELNIFCKPDYICVNDINAKNKMIDLGFKSETIVVTGNPSWDKLSTINIGKSSVKNLLLSIFIKEKVNGPIFTYMSSPIKQDGLDKYYGYDEFFVLSHIISFLQNRFRYEKPTLICLLHPRESSNKYDHLTVDNNDLSLISIKLNNEDKYGLLGFSKCFFGTISILLVEYALLGGSVLSFQPTQHQNRKVNFGYGIKTVYNTLDLYKYFDKVISIKQNAQYKFKASEKVVHQMLTCMGAV